MLLPTLAPKAIPQPWYIKKKTLQEELNQLAYDEDRYAQETEIALLTGSYEDNNNNNNNNNINNNTSTTHMVDPTATPPVQHQLEFQHPMSASPPRNDSVIQPMDETPIIDYATGYHDVQNDFDQSPLNISPGDPPHSHQDEDESRSI